MFWINKHPYHHRLFVLSGATIDLLVAFATLGVAGSSFETKAMMLITKAQIKKRMKQ